MIRGKKRNLKPYRMIQIIIFFQRILFSSYSIILWKTFTPRNFQIKRMKNSIATISILSFLFMRRTWGDILSFKSHLASFLHKSWRQFSCFHLCSWKTLASRDDNFFLVFLYACVILYKFDSKLRNKAAILLLKTEVLSEML